MVQPSVLLARAVAVMGELALPAAVELLLPLEAGVAHDVNEAASEGENDVKKYGGWMDGLKVTIKYFSCIGAKRVPSIYTGGLLPTVMPAPEDLMPLPRRPSTFTCPYIPSHN